MSVDKAENNLRIQKEYLCLALERIWFIFDPLTHGYSDAIIDIRKFLTLHIHKLDSGEPVILTDAHPKLPVDPRDYFKTLANNETPEKYVSVNVKKALEFAANKLKVMSFSHNRIHDAVDPFLEETVFKSNNFLFLVRSQKRSDKKEDVFVFLRSTMSKTDKKYVRPGIVLAQNLSGKLPMCPDSGILEQLIKRDGTQFITQVVAISADTGNYLENSMMQYEYEASIASIKKTIRSRILKYLWAVDDKSWDSHEDVFDKPKLPYVSTKYTRKGETVTQLMIGTSAVKDIAQTSAIVTSSVLGGVLKVGGYLWVNSIEKLPFTKKCRFFAQASAKSAGNKAVKLVDYLLTKPFVDNHTFDVLLEECAQTRPDHLDKNKFLDEELQDVNNRDVVSGVVDNVSQSITMSHEKHPHRSMSGLSAPHVVLKFCDSEPKHKSCKLENLILEHYGNGDTSYYPVSAYRVLDHKAPTMRSEFLYFERDGTSVAVTKTFSLPDRMDAGCFTEARDNDEFTSATCIVLFCQLPERRAKDAKDPDTDIDTGFGDFFCWSNTTQNTLTPRIDPRILAGISASNLGGEYSKAAGYTRDSEKPTLKVFPGRYRKNSERAGFRWARKSHNFGLTMRNMGFSLFLPTQNIRDFRDLGTVSGVLLYKDRENYRIIKIIKIPNSEFVFSITERKGGVMRDAWQDNPLDFEKIMALIDNHSKENETAQEAFFGENTGYTSAILRYGEFSTTMTSADAGWASLPHNVSLYIETELLLTRVISIHSWLNHYLPTAQLKAWALRSLLYGMQVTASAHGLPIAFEWSSKAKDAVQTLLIGPNLEPYSSRYPLKYMYAYGQYMDVNGTIPEYRLFDTSKNVTQYLEDLWYYNVTENLISKNFVLPDGTVNSGSNFFTFDRMDNATIFNIFGNLTTSLTVTEDQNISREILAILQPDVAKNVLPTGFWDEINARNNRKKITTELGFVDPHDPQKNQTQLYDERQPVFTIPLEERRNHERLVNETNTLHANIQAGLNDNDKVFLDQTETLKVQQFESTIGNIRSILSVNKDPRTDVSVDTYTLKQISLKLVNYLLFLKMQKDKLDSVNPKSDFLQLEKEYYDLGTTQTQVTDTRKNNASEIERSKEKTGFFNETKKTAVKELETEISNLTKDVGALVMDDKNNEEDTKDAMADLNYRITGQSPHGGRKMVPSQLRKLRNHVELRKKIVATENTIILKQDKLFNYYKEREKELDILQPLVQEQQNQIKKDLARYNHLKEQSAKNYSKIDSHVLPSIFIKNGTYPLGSKIDSTEPLVKGSESDSPFEIPYVTVVRKEIVDLVANVDNNAKDVENNRLANERAKGRQRGQKQDPEDQMKIGGALQKLLDVSLTDLSTLEKRHNCIEYIKLIYKVSDLSSFDSSDSSYQTCLGEAFSAEVERLIRFHTLAIPRTADTGNTGNTFYDPLKIFFGLGGAKTVPPETYANMIPISMYQLENMLRNAVESFVKLGQGLLKLELDYQKAFLAYYVNGTDDQHKEVKKLTLAINNSREGMKTLQQTVFEKATESFTMKVNSTTVDIALFDPDALTTTRDVLSKSLDFNNPNHDFLKGKPPVTWINVRDDNRPKDYYDAKFFTAIPVIPRSFKSDFQALSFYQPGKTWVLSKRVLEKLLGVKTSDIEETTVIEYSEDKDALFIIFKTAEEKKAFDAILLQKFPTTYEPWKKVLNLWP